jgi:hypothetical protein
MDLRTDSKRLLASLLLSCLLHASFFLMPDLGVSRSRSRPAEHGQLTPLPALNATLFLQPSAAADEVKPVPAKAGSTPEAAAERTAKDESRPPTTPGEGAGLLPAPAPGYFTPDQLTLRPQPAGEAELHTLETKLAPATGTLSLKLWISEFGDVIAVDIEKTDLPEIYAKAAVAGFMKLHFSPGERNGRRVGTVMSIQVSYEGGQKSPPRAAPVN